MKNIIIDDAVPLAQEMFSSLGKVTCIPGKKIQAKHLEKADALIVRSRTEVNQSLIEKSPVQFIGSTVVGLDHIDQPLLKEKEISFYSAQSCNANSVAEYVITCIINYAEQKQMPLEEKTLGIIGVGNVGKQVQKKAIALGLSVLANDPPRQEIEKHAQFVNLETALTADIITFHTPLNLSGPYPTHHLLNRHNINQVNKQALIINAARGGIIDENAWISYANQNPNLTSIIDCWENEPNINPKLHAIANIATPHIAGHALEAKIKGSLMVYKTLCLFWKQPETNDWQHHLPKMPNTIQLNSSSSIQHDIYRVLAKCYQPLNDHKAINLTNNTDFETYRRHYPIRREWSEYPVKTTNNLLLKKKLTSLGFKVL